MYCHREVFAKNKVLFHGQSEERNRLNEELLTLRSQDSDAFLERIFAMNDGRDHVGFKIFQGQNDAVLARLLEDPAIGKIVLYRRNVLAAYSSALAAKETGVWGAKASTRLAKRPKVRFAAANFVKFHDRRVQFYRECAARIVAARQQFHWIEYESLNEPAKMLNLLAFIGVKAGKPKDAEFVERRPAINVCGRFENAAEAEAFLRDHGLAHWAYEGEALLKTFDVDMLDFDEP